MKSNQMRFIHVCCAQARLFNIYEQMDFYWLALRNVPDASFGLLLARLFLDPLFWCVVLLRKCMNRFQLLGQSRVD